ncbi:MAG: ATP-dependent DNA helicase, partial [Gammaproteobacteria bacterium]|nr:ATP-dependent DNA helicase [Gammaproteobacteria bacterium]
MRAVRFRAGRWRIIPWERAEAAARRVLIFCWLYMIDRIFKEDGLFHTDMPGFVPRPGQQQMAQSVFESIRSGGKLVCESGTGTGKTYAYLVPAVLSGKCAVISTATRHLQEQIYFRDIPSVVRVLKRNARTALLKGRSNYLCRHRLKLAHLQTDLIDAEMGQSLSRISDWAVTTRSGDISEMENVPENSPVWRAVTSTSDNCLGGNCPEFLRCHVNSARKRAMESDLIVINHHVYFSDVSLKENGFGGLLPEHDAVVFDEAHSLPDIASSFYGFSMSSSGISDLIHEEERGALAGRSG